MTIDGPDDDVLDDAADVSVDEYGLDQEPDDLVAEKPKKKKKKKKVVVQEVVPAWVKWAGAAAAVLVIAALVFGFTQKQHADDLSSDASDRKAAAQVAGEFTQILFTYDSANPTSSLDRLKELATTSYQPKVDSARDAALATPTTGAEGVSMANTVSEVHLTEVDGNHVQAVTQSIWTLNAKGQALPLELYLRINLEKVDGTWKVADVTALTARQPGGATPPTTTPTSEPPASSSGG